MLISAKNGPLFIAYKAVEAVGVVDKIVQVASPLLAHLHGDFVDPIGHP